jgi:hypothetical protein
MTEEELKTIEWKQEDPNHGYGWEACDVYNGMRDDIRALIAEVRRLKIIVGEVALCVRDARRAMLDAEPSP